MDRPHKPMNEDLDPPARNSLQAGRFAIDGHAKAALRAGNDHWSGNANVIELLGFLVKRRAALARGQPPARLS